MASNIYTKIKPLFRFTGNLWFILILFSVLIITASVIKYFEGPKVMSGVLTTHYNNFLTFKYSFFHLIENKDLYLYYPQNHWDLFKYSPAFAVFMGFYAYLPEILGLILWNLTNFIPLFFAIKLLPGIKIELKAFLLWFILIELMTSIQNAQSNGLTLALMLFGFVFLEKKNPLWASFFLVLSVLIKIFGVVAFAIVIFYPDKLKFILWSLMWIIVFLFIPLIFVNIDQLIFIYKSWFKLLTTDYSESIGLSVMGWLRTWFGLNPGNNIIILVGSILLIVPLIKYKKWNEITFRLLYFALILIWVIIFNHKAESPTFVIAMCGIGIWYFTQEKKPLNFLLIILAFILTSLSPTDLFPPYIREHLIKPFVLKAIPAIFICVLLYYQLVFGKYKKNNSVIL
ncbi:MAG: DUF2029 domain-containing protein [Bacteroidetes bacterium]|nr:DUF2029 domain-containing protein [Bacteroidota bacterium]